VPLAPGTRLGPYGVVSAIGARGMGEVYRARDTKLNRDVALKILPDSFALDADRLARFRREAQGQNGWRGSSGPTVIGAGRESCTGKMAPR
jgi:serine/threonine protein kinase